MSQNEPSRTSTQPGVLPEDIRQNLKKYHQHAERLTCPECGYVGLMGIKARIKPCYATWWGSILLAAIAATIASALFGGIGMGCCHRRRFGRRTGTLGWPGNSLLPQLRSRPATPLIGAYD